MSFTKNKKEKEKVFLANIDFENAALQKKIRISWIFLLYMEICIPLHEYFSAAFFKY